MRARYMFATGRVEIRDMPNVVPASIVVRIVEINGHGREATLYRTSDYYNGALVFREHGAP